MQRRILSDDASLHDYRNHWLVRKSAAKALWQGYFQFELDESPEYGVAVLEIGGLARPSILDEIPALRFSRFINHSDSAIATPDITLLRVLSQFVTAVRWSLVSREIEVERPQQGVHTSPPSLFGLISKQAVVALAKVWRCLAPVTVRVQIYRCLRNVGSRLYGPSSSLAVQKLPFGMYLKTARPKKHEALANEYGALRLVQQHPHIPAPLPLDLVSAGSTSYLITSRVPGSNLGFCIDTLSEDEVIVLIGDLKRCLSELRAIPKDVGREYAITNALGKACYDYRIAACMDYDEERGDFIGPFVNEDEFNKTLQTPALPGVVHRSGHKIVLTHGDLNMRNVLMYNGRLSGIVDWENSGWYPEYWDYTKARYVTKLHMRWLKIVDEVFKEFGNFEGELATERQLWEYCF
ncbi:hypothetical protein VTK73DRAFT_9815 [Phialemonium thermophilum]|uniref:Aminoglycoside phosphotransferase domain-containing protein n=1 Tax=Phialemonium thermophilum TaxID=223376 RepID=A0ABR3XIG4_9PEZI